MKIWTTEKEPLGPIITYYEFCALDRTYTGYVVFSPLEEVSNTVFHFKVNSMNHNEHGYAIYRLDERVYALDNKELHAREFFKRVSKLGRALYG